MERIGIEPMTSSLQILLTEQHTTAGTHEAGSITKWGLRPFVAERKTSARPDLGPARVDGGAQSRKSRNWCRTHPSRAVRALSSRLSHAGDRPHSSTQRPSSSTVERWGSPRGTAVTRGNGGTFLALGFQDKRLAGDRARTPLPPETSWQGERLGLGTGSARLLCARTFVMLSPWAGALPGFSGCCSSPERFCSRRRQQTLSGLRDLRQRARQLASHHSPR